VTEFSQAPIAILEYSYRVVKPVPTLLNPESTVVEKVNLIKIHPRTGNRQVEGREIKKHAMLEPVIPLLGLTKSHSRQDQAS
jgi:hypothetical protein